jgi:hypothetical protein
MTISLVAKSIDESAPDNSMFVIPEGFSKNE